MGTEYAEDQIEPRRVDVAEAKSAEIWRRPSKTASAGIPSAGAIKLETTYTLRTKYPMGCGRLRRFLIAQPLGW